MNRSVFLAFLVVFTLAASRVPDVGIGKYQGEKVLIELFYEAECPYCTRFMGNQLLNLIQVPGIFEITQFQLYPFGNGKIYRNGRDVSFTCQHGESECQGNIIATCAIDLYPQIQSIPFAICLDTPSKNWRSIGQRCAEAFDLDWNAIEQCTNSETGHRAQYYTALATKAAGVKSVPTLYVDGIEEDDFNFKIRDNLLEYICKAYSGNITIPACQLF
jgi:interferon gamma-inducible protein 30